MHLITENNPTGYFNITETQLHDVFRDQHGKHVILFRERKGSHAIIAGYDNTELYEIEYYEGDNKGRFFRAVGKYNKTLVEQVFIKYLQNDESWYTEFVWNEVSMKPNWKSTVANCIVFFGSILFPWASGYHNRKK